MGSSAAEPVEVVLSRVASRWRAICEGVSRLAGAMRESIGAETLRSLLPDVDRRVEALHTAVARFEDAAKRPEVVIAMTGTTSSGKSTLANVLIGEMLLPKAVQEMSAGVVAVHHDPEIRRLIVEETKGARWPTGSWDVVEPEEVRARLESTMQTYRDLVSGDDGDAREQVDPPRFRVTWPTRMGRNAADFGLPVSARLTLVDLPGIKHIGDDLNARVIREQARKALCLVTYNANDVDPHRQETLLRQVVDQVKALSGSPARMLFVLNRIDAYRTDRDPEASERAFTDRVTRQIRDRIRDALPEYAAEAGGIEPVPFSSEPALFALLAESREPAVGAAILRKIDTEYGVLFAGQDLGALPRSPADWTETQRRWFVAETRHQSRLDAFEKRLGRHIATHLPELLVPDLVDESFRAARHVLESLDAVVAAYGHRERKQAEEAKRRLEELHQRLRALQKEVMAPLNPLREVAAGAGDLVSSLLAAVPEVEAALGIAGPGGEAGRLSALQSALTDAVQVPLKQLNDHVFRMMKGEAVDGELVESLPFAPKLRTAIEELRSSPYGRAWKEGASFEAADAECVASVIEKLARELSDAATELVRRESAIQAERMKAALETCGDAVVNRIETHAVEELSKAEFPGLRGVFRGAFELKPPRLPKVRFSAKVEQWSRTDERVEQEEHWVEKRVWWKLWLGKSLVQEMRPVVRRTKTKGIDVGKLGDLLEGFVSSAELRELEELFGAWLRESISDFDATLEQRLSAGVKTYRQLLQQRKEEIERGTQTRIESVEQHAAAVRNALVEADRGRDWRGIA